MTTNQLSASEANAFDYLIVGGGTAGCVIASRLAEYLPHKKILLIEAGPSDFMNDKVLKLKDWLNLLGGELDYDYGTTEQPNGKRQTSVSFFLRVSMFTNIMYSKLSEGNLVEIRCFIFVSKPISRQESETPLISEIYRKLTHPPFQSKSPRRLLLS